MYSVDDMFEAVAETGASDIALVPGTKPMCWVAGKMQPQENAPVLSHEDLLALAESVTDGEQRQQLEQRGDVNLSVSRNDAGRLRMNIHSQRNSYAVTARFIPYRIPPAEELSLPEEVVALADASSGLLLVTGRARSGKSTTIAAMVDRINRTSSRHVVTLEDPIEFVHRHQQSLVEQREIGRDCPNLTVGLQGLSRLRPDVVVVGEVQDCSSIRSLLDMAETGHLVIAGMPTGSIVETIGRIVDAFPADQQTQVRMQLATTVHGIVSQQLLPASGGGMVPALESARITRPVRRMLRDDRMDLLEGMVASGSGPEMTSMDQSLERLVREGRADIDEALRRARRPDMLARNTA